MVFRAAEPYRPLEPIGDGETSERWLDQDKPRDVWATKSHDTWGYWAYIWVPCLCVFLAAIVIVLNRLFPGRLSNRCIGACFLLFVGLAPLICMIIFIEVCFDTLLAMLFMHWGCMLFLPIVYLTFFHPDDKPLSAQLKVYMGMLVEEFKTGPSMRLFLGCLLGIFMLIIGLAFVALMSCRLFRWPLCIGNLTRHSRLYGLGYSLPFLISTSVYFSLINPTFEELFWRVFLHREIGKVVCPANLPDLKDLDSEEEPQPHQLCNECGRWLVSVLYASYHVVPVRFLVATSRAWWIGVLFGVGTVLCMSVLGRILVWARESPSLGIIGAWAIHVWVDIAVCLVFAASVFGYN